MYIHRMAPPRVCNTRTAYFWCIWVYMTNPGMASMQILKFPSDYVLGAGKVPAKAQEPRRRPAKSTRFLSRHGHRPNIGRKEFICWFLLKRIVCRNRCATFNRWLSHCFSVTLQTFRCVHLNMHLCCSRCACVRRE